MENTNNFIADLKVGFCNFGENWVTPKPVTEIIKLLEQQAYRCNIESYQEQVAKYGKASVSKYDHIPLFIPHSVYENTRKRTDDNGRWMYETFELSGVIHADLDGVPKEEFESVWDKLESTNPLFLFRSPNGGVKCFWVHNLQSTLLTKTLFMNVCRMFVKDTLTKLDLGLYYDRAPTTANSNCFFSGGDGFVIKSNIPIFKREHVKDLNPYLKDVALLAREEKRLEQVISEKRGKVETVGWNNISKERQERINARIEKFADDMMQDIIHTNSKSMGNGQSYRLACCCKGLGVGFERTLTELTLFKSRLYGATWCPREKTTAAFLGSSNDESFSKVVTKIPEELQLKKVQELIKSSERIPTPTFHEQRVPLESASGIIKDGIVNLVKDIGSNGHSCLAWVVTPGTGKSEAIKDSTFEIIGMGYKIGLYIDNKRDMREVEKDLFQRCPIVKVNDDWSYRVFTTCIQTIKGRESKIDTSQEQPENPTDHDYSLMCHMAKTLKHKTIETATTGFPLVADYCGKECQHGLSGCGTKCEYLQQMRSDSLIRVYNHAYAHGKQGNFENRDEWVNTRSRGDGIIFMSDGISCQGRDQLMVDTNKVVSVIDEDIMKDLVKVDDVTPVELEDIESKDFKVNLLTKYAPTDPKENQKVVEIINGYNDLGCDVSKKFQLEFMRKLIEVERISEDIEKFAETELELLLKVESEIKLNNAMKRVLMSTDDGNQFMRLNGLNPNKFNSIMGLSALCKLEKFGKFAVVPYYNKFAFQYIRKSKVNLTGSIVQLDGHAVKDILERGYEREFDFKRVSVDLHKDAKVIQVYNSTGSKQSLNPNIQSDKNKPRITKKVQAIADKAKECFTIGSKSVSESTGIRFDLTYGSCRGTNSIYHGMLKYNKPLLMVNDYKVNIDGVNQFYRAFYPELGTPDLTYDDKALFVREMKSGVHETVTGRRFNCPIVHSIYDFLSRSEVEQGVHRARLVRHGSTVVCLFNTVLDFPVSELIDINDYLEIVDGRSEKSKSVKDSNVGRVVDSMIAKGVIAIPDKPKAFAEHGLTLKQYKTLKPTPEIMAQHGLETHDVTLVDSVRRKSKATMFAFPDADLSSIDFGKKRFVDTKVIEQIAF